MKQRFPPRQFPGITWEQLNVVEAPVLTPEIMQVDEKPLRCAYMNLVLLLQLR